MGWKNVKEHYRIGHIVHVVNDQICIGSPYISDIMVIDQCGMITKRYDGRSNHDLVRYQAEMDADPATLKQLIATPDCFSASVAVYTHERGQIIEKSCEAPGWPNVTHDGSLMYENTFSTDRQQVVAWAKRNAEIGVKHIREAIVRTEAELQNLRQSLEEEEAVLRQLESFVCVK